MTSVKCHNLISDYIAAHKGGNMICEKCNQDKVSYGAYSCKSCRIIYMEKWNKENREYKNQKSREWVENNPEKRKEISKKSDAKHRDKRILYHKDHYRKNVDKYKEWAKKQTTEQRRAIKQRYLAKLKANKIGSYSREVIFKRDNYKCVYCGDGATEIDHKTPISRGGSDSKRNVVACCKSCNKEKHTKTVKEYFKYREKIKLTHRPK